jgi:hypothetical protein
MQLVVCLLQSGWVGQVGCAVRTMVRVTHPTLVIRPRPFNSNSK